MTIMREERAQDAHDLDNVTYNLAVVVALLAVGSVLLFRVKLGTPRGVPSFTRNSSTDPTASSATTTARLYVTLSRSCASCARSSRMIVMVIRGWLKSV